MKQQNFFQNIDLIKSKESDPQIVDLFNLNEIKEILDFYEKLPLANLKEKKLKRNIGF